MSQKTICEVRYETNMDLCWKCVKKVGIGKSAIIDNWEVSKGWRCSCSDNWHLESNFLLYNFLLNWLKNIDLTLTAPLFSFWWKYFWIHFWFRTKLSVYLQPPINMLHMVIPFAQTGCALFGMLGTQSYIDDIGTPMLPLGFITFSAKGRFPLLLSI